MMIFKRVSLLAFAATLLVVPLCAQRDTARYYGEQAIKARAENDAARAAVQASHGTSRDDVFKVLGIGAVVLYFLTSQHKKKAKPTTAAGNQGN